MYRLSYERRGDISFIARETISYFVTRKKTKESTVVNRHFITVSFVPHK